MGLQFINFDSDDDLIVDWDLLNRQKQELEELIVEDDNNILWGLIEFIEYLQDLQQDYESSQEDEEGDVVNHMGAKG